MPQTTLEAEPLSKLKPPGSNTGSRKDAPAIYSTKSGLRLIHDLVKAEKVTDAPLALAEVLEQLSRVECTRRQLGSLMAGSYWGARQALGGLEQIALDIVANLLDPPSVKELNAPPIDESIIMQDFGAEVTYKTPGYISREAKVFKEAAAFTFAKIKNPGDAERFVASLSLSQKQGVAGFIARAVFQNQEIEDPLAVYRLLVEPNPIPKGFWFYCQGCDSDQSQRLVTLIPYETLAGLTLNLPPNHPDMATYRNVTIHSLNSVRKSFDRQVNQNPRIREAKAITDAFENALFSPSRKTPSDIAVLARNITLLPRYELCFLPPSVLGELLATATTGGIDLSGELLSKMQPNLRRIVARNVVTSKILSPALTANFLTRAIPAEDAALVFSSLSTAERFSLLKYLSGDDLAKWLGAVSRGNSSDLGVDDSQKTYEPYSVFRDHIYDSETFITTLAKTSSEKLAEAIANLNPNFSNHFARYVYALLDRERMTESKNRILRYAIDQIRPDNNFREIYFKMVFAEIVRGKKETKLDMAILDRLLAKMKENNFSREFWRPLFSSLGKHWLSEALYQMHTGETSTPYNKIAEMAIQLMNPDNPVDNGFGVRLLGFDREPLGQWTIFEAYSLFLKKLMDKGRRVEAFEDYWLKMPPFMMVAFLEDGLLNADARKIIEQLKGEIKVEDGVVSPRRVLMTLMMYDLMRRAETVPKETIEQTLAAMGKQVRNMVFLSTILPSNDEARQKLLGLVGMDKRREINKYLQDLVAEHSSGHLVLSDLPNDLRVIAVDKDGRDRKDYNFPLHWLAWTEKGSIADQLAATVQEIRPIADGPLAIIVNFELPTGAKLKQFHTGTGIAYEFPFGFRDNAKVIEAQKNLSSWRFRLEIDPRRIASYVDPMRHTFVREREDGEIEVTAFAPNWGLVDFIQWMQRMHNSNIFMALLNRNLLTLRKDLNGYEMSESNVPEREIRLKRWKDYVEIVSCVTDPNGGYPWVIVETRQRFQYGAGDIASNTPRKIGVRLDEFRRNVTIELSPVTLADLVIFVGGVAYFESKVVRMVVNAIGEGIKIGSHAVVLKIGEVTTKGGAHALRIGGSTLRGKLGQIDEALKAVKKTPEKASEILDTLKERASETMTITRQKLEEIGRGLDDFIKKYPLPPGPMSPLGPFGRRRQPENVIYTG